LGGRRLEKGPDPSADVLAGQSLQRCHSQPTGESDHRPFDFVRTAILERIDQGHDCRLIVGQRRTKMAFASDWLFSMRAVSE